MDQRHQHAEATRSRQATSSSSNGSLALNLGSGAASELPYLTSCSSASEVEVQLGGHKEAEGILLAVCCGYRDRALQFEVSAARGSKGPMRAMQKVEGLDDCVHAYTKGTPCVLSSLAIKSPPGLLKRANASAGLWLGSPKDLGLLFIRPYETCYCWSCLELCRFRASSLQWAIAPSLCRVLHLPRRPPSGFRRRTRPCWPCCGRAGGGVGMPAWPTGWPAGEWSWGAGAAGGRGKRCRKSFAPELDSPGPLPGPQSPCPGPPLAQSWGRRTPHGFLDRSAIPPPLPPSNRDCWPGSRLHLKLPTAQFWQARGPGRRRSDTTPQTAPFPPFSPFPSIFFSGVGPFNQLRLPNSQALPFPGCGEESSVRARLCCHVLHPQTPYDLPNCNCGT